MNHQTHRHCLQLYSVGQDLPLLVITTVPLPEDNSSAIMYTFIAVKGIHVKLNIVDHPYSSEATTDVPALRPQNRLIKIVWIVTDQPNWMATTNGMLNCLPSDLVDKRKSMTTLFILHPSTPLLILVPMLILIGGIGRCENNIAATDGERVIWGSFGDNLESWFVGGESRRRRIRSSVNLMVDMVNSGGRKMRIVDFMRNVVDGSV